MCKAANEKTWSAAKAYDPGGSQANASKIDALALSKRDATAGFADSSPSRPSGETKGKTFSRSNVLLFNASGTDRSNSEQFFKKATKDTSMASRQERSCDSLKWRVPSSACFADACQRRKKPAMCEDTAVGPVERAALMSPYPDRTQVQTAPGAA